MALHGSHQPGASRGGGLAAPALQRQGIAQALGSEQEAAPLSDPDTLSDAMMMLKAGAVGAEQFMSILAALAGQILPQMEQGLPGQEQGPQGELQGPQAPPSIAGLLG